MSDIVMGIHNTEISETELFRRVSWGAIFGGVLVALSIELVFLAFGLFIGFQFRGGAAEEWTIGWYLLSTFVSVFIGAWVAAKLSGNPSRANGMLHGLIVWGLTMFTTAVAAGVVMWDVVRTAVGFLEAATITVPAAPAGPPHVNLPVAAANAAHDISMTALVVFGGLILALLGSMIGGGAVPTDINFIGAHRPHLPEQPHHA